MMHLVQDDMPLHVDNFNKRYPFIWVKWFIDLFVLLNAITKLSNHRTGVFHPFELVILALASQHVLRDNRLIGADRLNKE